MTTKEENNSFISRMSYKQNLNCNALRAMLVMLLFVLGIGNAWGGSAYMSAKSADPAQGLVYSSTNSNAPPTDKYQEYYPGGCVVGTTGTDASPANKCYYSAGSSTGPHTTYAWAKPARGYKFKEWTGYMTKTSDSKTNINTASDRSSWNGSADLVKNSAGGRQCTYTRIVASFEPATSYTITYAKPVGGSYTVGYSYLKTKERSTATFYNASGTANSYKDYEFYTDNSESYSLSPSSDGNQAVTSYADDGITMTASGANFVGWYEGTTQKSTSASYTDYKASANATITALFKLAILGEATGDLSPAVIALGSNNYTITLPIIAYGSWSASDFTVAFTEQTSPARNDVTKGTVTYSQTSGNVLSSTGTLTIPFTYNPATWGNTDVLVTITPAIGGVYGTAISFHILASATEPVTEEAQLWENGVKTQTGTLAAMVAAANALSTNPTVKLMQNKTIEAPLSLQKSMKFDLNDKKITSTGTSAFSIDAASIDVQIVDEGFGGIGEIATSSAQNGNVNVVTFTQKAKLTMQGGTLSATNTGSGSAYGINVTQGSTFYMTNGLLTVTAASGSAEGVHVATANDYATLNGGSITVTAPVNAYGLWSAGQSNITDATIDVKTTTGTSGYGFYVNGGVTTLTEVATTVSVKTAGAGGGFVKAGRLNVNGGSIAVTAETSDVYGVYVAAGATANIQQNATITAQATGASGTKVFGINNLGTVSLTNVSVTATSPTTNATAVNTATSAVSTTIEGGTYRANTTGGTAYGLHHQYGTLNVDGGELKAVGSGNSIYGARATVDATIANASIWGETQGSGNTAYGFVGGVANKNITLTNCTITGLSATSKAYAIYSRANVTATGCTLTATTTGTNEAYGLYAENGTNKLVNTDATVTSNTIQAYGINHLDGSLTIEGGRFEVTAEQKTAGADEESKLYGIYNAANKISTVANAEFVVRATNASYAKYIYGAYTLGTLNSTNTIYDVKGKVYARGIYNSGTLNLQNNTITAENTNGSDCYGIYATNKFTINGDEVFAKSNLKTVYAMTFGASAEGDVLAGKFYATGNGTNDFGAITQTGTIGKVRLKGGVYKTVSNLQRYAYTGLSVYNLDDTHPDYAAGYRYTIAAENPSPYVCYIKNGNKYETLAAALQYTKDNSGNYIIIMSQNHTLPAGDYELPSNATLIVPYKAGQETLATAPVKRNTAGLIEEHIRLTLASGANLNVSGKIEVGGELYCVESGLISYNNSPYAHIRMEEGSLIQLNSGARLYAWGFVTGAGNITVKNGAEVHEMFQIGDMPAMSPLVQSYNNNSHKFFPLNQYFIQNIEAQTTYYYGSKLICSFSNYYTGSYNGDDNIKLVGTESSLFLITSTDESSWVRKSYDAAHDYQVWEVNSDVKLGSLSLSISGYTFNSTKYILPVTSNMKIHVLDGDFAITQSTQFLPGTQIEVNKTASLKVNSGQKVYMFDKDQWPFSAKTIAFSPSWPNGNKPSRSGLFVDAALNVHGKINVEGSLYTSNKGTTTKTDGANIYSTNADAGTISYNVASPSATTITLMTSGTATTSVSMESAKLKNGDGTYASTSGTSSGEAWVYMNNAWVKTYTNGCFEVIGSTVYAKPSEYVALKKSQTVGGKLTGVEETNHTYLTAEDKILILMDECQWWEVEATDDPTVFECKKEGYEGFYYYNTSTNKWTLKTVNVKFYSAETGDNVLKTIVTDYNGIPDQAVIATNPTKATTAEFTYSFYGWKSSVTGTDYKWTDPLEVATADMSYRPVFTATKRNYTITLVNANNGANVPLEVPYGEKPSYEPIKDADAHYTYSFKDWTSGSNHYATCAAMPTVTGTATYTANWNNTVNNYNITWKNGETVLETDENQDYGTATAYNGTLPTKEADENFAYTFSGWKSSLTGTTYANGSTPAVGGETTYEAQYSTTPRYAVTFNNYDGTQLARTIYTQGETPAYEGLPTRKRDADGYFKFIGWKNSNGDPYASDATLPAVTKKETYTAQYTYVTDLYLITLNNVDGNGATWSGKFGVGSIPFYNPNDDDVPVTPAKEGNAQYSYPFLGWTPELVAVTGPATYTAQFGDATLNKYTITFKNEDGSIISGYPKTLDYGATIVKPAEPTKESNETIMYTFTGWSPSVPETVTGDGIYIATFSSATPVASVTAGSTTSYCSTLQEAFTAANSRTECVIKILKNVSGLAAESLIYTKANGKCTFDLNNHTVAGSVSTVNQPKVMAVNAEGCTFKITDSSASKNGKFSMTMSSGRGSYHAIEVLKGTIVIENGCVYATSPRAWTTSDGSNYAFQANAIVLGAGTSLQMTGGTLEAHGQLAPHAIRADGSSNITISGGTLKATAEVTSASAPVTVPAAVYTEGGITTISGGTFISTTKTTAAYNIYATSASQTVNITGGLFKVSGGSTLENVNSAAATSNINLTGGYYSHEANLSKYATVPYYVLETTVAEKAEVGNEYNYKIEEVPTYYYIDPTTGTETSVSSASAPEDPADYNDEDYTYTFSEWQNDGSVYRAVYTSSERTYGDKLDIIDWTAEKIVINANGLKAVNGGTAWTIKYASNYTKNDRAADRTLEVARDKAHETANGYVVIKLQGTSGVESRQKYTVPLIYDANTTLSGTTENSIVYVHTGATLTVNANTTISELYVAPGASVNITDGTLKIGKLVLRTLPWQAASISGNFTATETWYTRIAPNKRKITDIQGKELSYEAASYYQFALPLGCEVALKDVKVSNQANTPYGSTWLLKSYEEANRAAKGTSDDANWVALGENDNIQGGVGYELFSNSAYYREFYFPVDPSKAVKTIPVSYTSGGKAGVNHAGWNIVASPLMGVYDNSEADPETGLKVSWYLKDGSYFQVIPSYIYPAIPFTYQAIANQSSISFAGSSIVAAPRRMAVEDEPVRLQWIHVDVKDAQGVGDQTSILSHPTRYEESYKTGIDVAKQSLTASRALLYSTHAYGDMAFAGVSDSKLTNGIPLVVYSPKAQELTISMRENAWLNRLTAVWLIDHETGIRTDLLWSTYTFDAAEGTAKGRFTLMGEFKAPQVTTGLENGQSDQEPSTKARKVIIEDKIYIQLNGHMYDSTGKKVN